MKRNVVMILFFVVIFLTSCASKVDSKDVKAELESFSGKKILSFEILETKETGKYARKLKVHVEAEYSDGIKQEAVVNMKYIKNNGEWKVKDIELEEEWTYSTNKPLSQCEDANTLIIEEFERQNPTIYFNEGTAKKTIDPTNIIDNLLVKRIISNNASEDKEDMQVDFEYEINGLKGSFTCDITFSFSKDENWKIIKWEQVGNGQIEWAGEPTTFRSADIIEYINLNGGNITFRHSVFGIETDSNMRDFSIGDISEINQSSEPKIQSFEEIIVPVQFVINNDVYTLSQTADIVYQKNESGIWMISDIFYDLTSVKYLSKVDFTGTYKGYYTKYNKQNECTIVIDSYNESDGSYRGVLTFKGYEVMSRDYKDGSYNITIHYSFENDYYYIKSGNWIVKPDDDWKTLDFGVTISEDKNILTGKVTNYFYGSDTNYCEFIRITN